MRWSALFLTMVGLLGVAFFWATDPRWGFSVVGENGIDAANEAMIPTMVGMVGSGIVLLIGVWLVTRKSM